MTRAYICDECGAVVTEMTEIFRRRFSYRAVGRFQKGKTQEFFGHGDSQHLCRACVEKAVSDQERES